MTSRVQILRKWERKIVLEQGSGKKGSQKRQGGSRDETEAAGQSIDSALKVTAINALLLRGIERSTTFETFSSDN